MSSSPLTPSASAWLDVAMIYGQIVQGKGGTFDPWSMAGIASAHGFEVGERLEWLPNTECYYAETAFSLQDLSHYLTTHAQTARVQGLRIGAWQSNGNVWLNLTAWRPHRLDAIQACIHNLQVAAFDHAKAATLPKTRRWQALCHVLSDDRRAIRPESLAELADDGIDEAQAYRLLHAAWSKWDGHVQSPSDQLPPPSHRQRGAC